jgi:hypothetical protein
VADRWAIARLKRRYAAQPSASPCGTRARLAVKPTIEGTTRRRSLLVWFVAITRHG